MTARQIKHSGVSARPVEVVSAPQREQVTSYVPGCRSLFLSAMFSSYYARFWSPRSPSPGGTFVRSKITRELSASVSIDLMSGQFLSPIGKTANRAPELLANFESGYCRRWDVFRRGDTKLNLRRLSNSQTSFAAT